MKIEYFEMSLPNKIVLFHCSNLPRSFFKDTKMTIHPIISDLKGGELSYGAIQGRIKSEPERF